MFDCIKKTNFFFCYIQNFNNPGFFAKTINEFIDQLDHQDNNGYCKWIVQKGVMQSVALNPKDLDDEILENIEKKYEDLDIDPEDENSYKVVYNASITPFNLCITEYVGADLSNDDNWREMERVSDYIYVLSFPSESFCFYYKTCCELCISYFIVT